MKKLKEIVIKTPSESLSPEIVNSIKTIVVEFIVEQLKFAANSYLKRTANIVDYYLQPDVLDVFTSFITDQMIFNNYEVFKNGKEILVSHNNRNMINEEDIRDYIESNPELQSYLRQLLYTFYQKNVDVGCLTKAALQQAYKDQRYFKKEEDAYDSSDVLLTVEYAMENNDCNYYGFPDVIEDNDFNGFLTQEFNKADVIKEIIVQPSSLLPMVDLKTGNDGDEHYFLNYENVLKNLKGFKRIIATHLGIPISPELNNFLAFYISQLQEMEYAGETDSYADMTPQEFLDDIKSVHEYSSPEEWVHNPNYDIYSAEDLQEIKVTSPVYIKMLSPKRGKIYVDGQPIELENYDGEHYSLDEYDEEVYAKYGISFNNNDEDFNDDEDEAFHNEEYYPTEESKKLVQILLPKLKHLGAKIADNGYGVSIIDIPIKNVAPIVQADYPVYLGNGEFKYKDKTITYKQAFPGSREYQIYNSNGDLIKTTDSPNTDFDSYMSFLTDTGQDTYTRNFSPYGILTSLTEIKVQPYNFTNMQPLTGQAKVTTDYFSEGHLMHLVDLGSYYTFIPYGNQKLVVLIPKQYIELTEYNDTYLPWHTEEHVRTGIDSIKNLINQGKIEIIKPMQTESVKSFKDLLLESYQKKVKLIIQEYSEKTINSTIERWKTKDPQLDVNTAKQLIQRFDQIKSGLTQKLDTLSLSDELKQGNNYLNIEKYSYDDMVKLIRTLPENPEKKKKEAVEKFVKKEQIDKPIAQSYVARFMANQDKLKSALSNGTEDGLYTKEGVMRLIPRSLLQNEAYLDPRNWNFHSLEQMLDALFPSQSKNSEDINSVSTDADKIYDKDGIEIYKGDDKHKCISYNPVLPSTNNQKYSWCVTQSTKAKNMYDYYRLKDESPTFYFIFDRNKSSAPDHSPFEDVWHAFVIRISIDGKKYYITHADNPPDAVANSWEDIAKIVPADTWAKIKGLKDYFKPIELSSSERSLKFAKGRNLSLSEFKELSPDEKLSYVIGKAQENKLSNDILQILPKIKTIEGGASTTLANVAINNGQKFPYYILKDSEALSKRYAIFRFRQNEAIPLPFVKYLDEEAQQKYLETFDGNLTFEYIDKYFGEKAARNYVEAQAKDLKFLPPSAVKYIQSPNLKKFYELFFKLSTPWRYSADTNIDEEDLGNLTSMPTQSVLPVPIDKEQWAKLSPAERKTVIDLTEKFNGDSKYIELLYALPIIVKDGNKKYIMLPESNTDDFYAGGNWLIMDEQGNVVKNDISGSSSLGDLSLMSWYPSEFNEYKKVYDINDLKVA